MILMLFRGRRLLMTFAVLLGAGLLCSLGVWQWNRHIERDARNARIDARLALPPVTLDGSQVDPQQLDYRPVSVRGTYDSTQEVLLRNRSYDGVTGYHLLTPLHITGSDQSVLVDRGWIPLTQSAPEARRAFAVTGDVQLTGVARASQSSLAGPPDPPFSADRPRLDAWFRVDIDRIQQQVGYRLLPVFVELQPASDVPAQPPTLPQPSRTANTGPGSHLSYTLQWFSFAIILVVGYVVLSLRQLRGVEEGPGSRG
jgi:surfeit locus 1 family protein